MFHSLILGTKSFNIDRSTRIDEVVSAQMKLIKLIFLMNLWTQKILWCFCFVEPKHGCLMHKEPQFQAYSPKQWPAIVKFQIESFYESFRFFVLSFTLTKAKKPFVFFSSRLKPTNSLIFLAILPVFKLVKKKTMENHLLTSS